jgi:hypothetical protein
VKKQVKEANECESLAPRLYTCTNKRQRKEKNGKGKEMGKKGKEKEKGVDRSG